MPCYTQQQVEQVLDGIKDINLLAEGLREMGFGVTISGQNVAFNGRDATGKYQSGYYSNGTLVSQNPIDIVTLKKYVGVATIKKQAKSHKWTLEPVKGNPFAFKLTK